MSETRARRGHLVAVEGSSATTITLTKEQKGRAQLAIGLVHKALELVAPMFPSLRDGDDLRQMGMEALCLASIRFDPNLGTEFEAFAGQAVRGAMIRGGIKLVRQPLRHLVRRWLETTDDVSQFLEIDRRQLRKEEQAIDELQENVRTAAVALFLAFVGLEQEARSPESELGAAERNDKGGHELQRALAVLDDEERRLVELRYWGGLTMVAVAETMGLPERTAHRRHKGAVDKMKKALRSLA